MMLTLEGRTPCVLCGCQLRHFAFPMARINKRSIKLARPDRYMAAGDWRCPECGHPAAVETDLRYRLSAESAAEVDTYRAARWPAAVAS